VAFAVLLPTARAGAIGRADLESRILKLRSSLDSLADAVSEVEQELDASQGAVDRHSRALATASSRLKLLRSARSRRSAEMFMIGGMGVMETLATAESIGVFTERLSYLERIRASEQGTLENLVALRRRAKTEGHELASARDRAAEALRSLTARRKDLDSRLRDYQALLSLIGGRVPARASRARIAGFICPVRGPHAISNNYGERRRSGIHTGVDMPANTGTPVVAVLGSRVVDVVRGGWMGRGVIIRDIGGNEWWYAHLSSEYVTPGEHLSAGQVLGRVGCAGNCTGPHLHFEYHPGGGEPRNPYRILRSAC
jgi:murein DD-endopeptidase MepM/ murein hydrolase activator NlpD